MLLDARRESSRRTTPAVGHREDGGAGAALETTAVEVECS